MIRAGLSLEPHVSQAVKKRSAILASLNRIRSYFMEEALKAIVYRHISYCLCVLGHYHHNASKVLLHKVQKVINYSARVIAGPRKFNRFTPVLSSLVWSSTETLGTSWHS